MYPGERFNGYSHLAGLILALAGAAWLLAKVLPLGQAHRLAGAVVFALSVIALYAASTLYHSTRGRAKAFWQRVDHCAIYVLIAGTFTPFALGAVPDRWSVLALLVMWGLACLGIWRELRSPEAIDSALWLYLIMGWFGVIAALHTEARLTPGALALLLLGAILYSAGTVFYRNRRGLRHAHGTWHLFVLGGTASHYVAIAGFVF